MENTPSPGDKRQPPPAGNQAPLPAPDSATEQSEQSPDDLPHPDDYDTLERRRFGPMGFIPAAPWLTVALCLGFVGLLVYGVVSGNALAFALVAVVAVFIGVPYLLLYLFNGRRLPPRNYAPLVDDVKQWRPDGEKASYSANANAPEDSREPLDGALPAAGLGEPNTGNGHRNDRGG